MDLSAPTDLPLCDLDQEDNAPVLQALLETADRDRNLISEGQNPRI